MRSRLRRRGSQDARPGRGPSPAATHPERTGDPAVLRWAVHGVELPFAGSLVAAPGLDGLLGAELEAVTVVPGALLVTAAHGGSWRELGPRVRTALTTALGSVDDWVPGPDARPLDADETLHWSARELIDGPVGELAAVHGGAIELVGARDGVVTVRLRGACRGCPAAALTMTQRLETQLRRRVPGARAVEEA
ncbi:NifU family protein [Propionibacterium australiense]|nr:NifU family protein [Propionibacterium australiense]RLP08195.1 NifU family protein [Propionibacterium australiense]RLP08277.1 NifU family protein [Propionibacterium australiense]